MHDVAVYPRFSLHGDPSTGSHPESNAGLGTDELPYCEAFGTHRKAELRLVTEYVFVAE